MLGRYVVYILRSVVVRSPSRCLPLFDLYRWKFDRRRQHGTLPSCFWTLDSVLVSYVYRVKRRVACYVRTMELRVLSSFLRIELRAFLPGDQCLRNSHPSLAPICRLRHPRPTSFTPPAPAPPTSPARRPTNDGVASRGLAAHPPAGSPRIQAPVGAMKLEARLQRRSRDENRGTQIGVSFG